MRKVEACLFDLDGVIVDTAKYHYLAWKRLAGELGFEFTEQENERLKGVSRMRSLDILLEVGNLKFDEETKERLAARKNGWYVEYISRMDESEVLPGVKDFLARLKGVGMKIGLGSASKNAMTIMKNIGMVEPFDVIIDGTKVSKAKPDPEVFVRGARELGIDPSRCVVFEDAEAGVEAAKRAGMGTVGIGTAEGLKQADYVIQAFTELAEAEQSDVVAFLFGRSE